MKFTIIIPTYNREKKLKEWLYSILKQTLLPPEVLIVDDGNLSTKFLDETKKRFNSKKVNY